MSTMTRLTLHELPIVCVVDLQYNLNLIDFQHSQRLFVDDLQYNFNLIDFQHSQRGDVSLLSPINISFLSTWIK